MSSCTSRYERKLSLLRVKKTLRSSGCFAIGSPFQLLCVFPNMLDIEKDSVLLLFSSFIFPLFHPFWKPLTMRHCFRLAKIIRRWNVCMILLFGNLFLIGDPTATAARNADHNFFKQFLIDLICRFDVFGIGLLNSLYRSIPRICAAVGGQPGTWRSQPLQQLPTPRPEHFLSRNDWPTLIVPTFVGVEPSCRSAQISAA